MVRTEADIMAAYEAWQGGADWASVARLHGYPTVPAAMMSVRRFVGRNKLPLRREGAVPDENRVRVSYCAYLLGWGWSEIAAQHGWASGPSAQASVTRYAVQHGLALRRLP